MKTWGKECCRPALHITREELLALGITEAEITRGEAHGDMTTRGPWSIPVRYVALCMSAVWTPVATRKHTGERESETAYGKRTLTNLRESGHQFEGQVSVNGRKVRGFTSSQLFELPDGKLINVATIHACIGPAH